MYRIDRFKFFRAYRAEFGSIRSTKVVQNMNVMLAALVEYQHLLDQFALIPQMAYIAATVKHETPTSNKYGAGKELRQRLTNTPRRREVRRLQDRYWPSGYYGRGPVQLTWRNNYAWAETVTGRNLLSNPDLLLEDLKLGYEVTIRGMLAGQFGRPLGRYINADQVDYRNARRSVNIMDQADRIAGYAVKFERIFNASVEKE
jgi:hypothetical protein